MNNDNKDEKKLKLIVMMIMLKIIMIMIMIMIIIIIIISNGNRTEWSPVRSVITSMITDRIGRHEVLFPINHNFNKICEIIGYFLNQNTKFEILFC